MTQHNKYRGQHFLTQINTQEIKYGSAVSVAEDELQGGRDECYEGLGTLDGPGLKAVARQYVGAKRTFIGRQLESGCEEEIWYY